ncbi:tyrosinase family protein [Labrys neptuniae]
MPFASITRRGFLGTAAAGLAALHFSPARAAAKYRRWNVASPQGQKMLASYAKGVQAMLALPPDNPHNWFRNAFVHLMDCPHGNWWFYVWHRGYIGNFEQTIRELSGDPDFTLPYWDWTQSPQIPDSMFDGVLTPTSSAFAPYTENLAIFTRFIQQDLMKYWNGLSSSQTGQLATRGYKQFGDMWNDVTGAGVAGNESFAVTSGARYLSRTNPKLDASTTYAVSPFMVYSGLLANDFNNAVNYLSFTSSKTSSHNAAASGPQAFSVLEGQPHNLVHNCIGGVGAIDPGPYGNMTNFLSPVDPIFFLHHANMDRLWDVWTRKQQSLNQAYLPAGKELAQLSSEPFLFFVDAKGNYLTNGKAGDYLSTDVFGYDYEPGFGEDVIHSGTAQLAARRATPLKAKLRANTASVSIPAATVKLRSEDAIPKPLMAEITVTRPHLPSDARQFDVVVNAPSGVTQVGPDSPYYGGTIGFFGPPMGGMNMSHDATFVIPIPNKLPAFTATEATQGAAALNIRVQPSHGQQGTTPTLKAVSIGTL